MYFLGQIDRGQIFCNHYMMLHSSKPWHKELGLMYNGSRDDVDRAAHFLPKTSNHPVASTLHSGFRPLNGASIGPSSVVRHPFVLYWNIVYSTTVIPPFESTKIILCRQRGISKKLHVSIQLSRHNLKNKKSEYHEGYSDGPSGETRTPGILLPNVCRNFQTALCRPLWPFPLLRQFIFDTLLPCVFQAKLSPFGMGVGLDSVY